jgi:hypothetical protein
MIRPWRGSVIAALIGRRMLLWLVIVTVPGPGTIDRHPVSGRHGRSDGSGTEHPEE